MKNIALTGGGTAGHITPNLALIPELKKRNYNIIYIGSKNGMEKDIMSKHNIPFFGISADKLRRYHDIKNFAMPFNVIRGIAEAKKILKEQKKLIIDFYNSSDNNIYRLLGYYNNQSDEIINNIRYLRKLDENNDLLISSWKLKLTKNI